MNLRDMVTFGGVSYADVGTFLDDGSLVSLYYPLLDAEEREEPRTLTPEEVVLRDHAPGRRVEEALRCVSTFVSVRQMEREAEFSFGKSVVFVLFCSSYSIRFF